MKIRKDKTIMLAMFPQHNSNPMQNPMSNPMIERFGENPKTGYTCLQCNHFKFADGIKPARKLKKSATSLRYRPVCELAKTDDEHFGGMKSCARFSKYVPELKPDIPY